MILSVSETEETGCEAGVKSLSTWLRILESYSRKRASIVKDLPPISKCPTQHYPAPPTRPPVPPLCYYFPLSWRAPQPSFSQLPRLRLKHIFPDVLSGCPRALGLGTVAKPPGNMRREVGVAGN